MVGNAMLRRASRITGVPLWILQRVDRQEGSGTSPKGARGEFQLMPGTARRLEQQYKINTSTTWGNALGGAYYLSEQYHTFGRWDYALAAYNAGPGAVHQYHGIPPYKETRDYVASIMSGKPPRSAAPGQSPGQLPAAPSAGLPGAGAPLATPNLTPDMVAGEGLQALASGDYDPVKGLSRMLDAAHEMERVALANSGMTRPPMNNNGQPGTPNVSFAGGGSKFDKRALAFVRMSLGTPYVWGGSKPDGFDCSGLLYWAWGKVGVKIPRTSEEQWAQGRPVKGALRVGDAVFFHGAHHVGFYVGNGRFIEAAHTGTNVRVSKLAGRKDYIGARRFA